MNKDKLIDSVGSIYIDEWNLEEFKGTYIKSLRSV